MSINIPLFDGKYRMTSDAFNIIVDKPTERYDKKGNQIFASPRFYKSIEHALTETASRSIRDSDITTLLQLAETVNHTNGLIKDVYGTIESL